MSQYFDNQLSLRNLLEWFCSSGVDYYMNIKSRFICQTLRNCSSNKALKINLRVYKVNFSALAQFMDPQLSQLLYVNFSIVGKSIITKQIL